jgi:RNase P/RNase MRP subunit p29
MARRIWIVTLSAVILALVVAGIAWAQEADPAQTPAGQPRGSGPTSSTIETAVRPPLRLQDGVVRGTVTHVQDGQVSVETADGETARLLVTDDTYFWVPGEPPTTTTRLKIGDPVVALGQPETGDPDEKTVTARLLVVASDEELPRIFVRGRALAITKQTLVVQTGRGERAIAVRPRTRLQSYQGRLASLRSIRPGDQIIALGQPTEMGQWIAGLVLVPGANPLARNGIRGQVTAIAPDEGTLTLSTVKQGEITVLTSDQTRYRIPDTEQPSFADIHVGDTVVVMGRPEPGSQTRVQAQGIGVLPPRDKKE